MKLRTMGAIGRKKPIAMQARQVKISKTAFAAILATPRLICAARKLPYQSRTKAAIAAAIRMARLLFALSLAPHFGRMRGAGSQNSRGPRQALRVGAPVGLDPATGRIYADIV